ncbi:hypothetical protein [Treponema phagedenis]|uniref:hypothetical protein n=1 Tax=Treponema phagedenis TaxID=162 RepID=UPI0001F63C4B|nr:hypothetical protein [Treponema phagedenis]EFW37971.1 hypothetical protein HMPREF9554_01531 [Treponema phagedenis F0421]TYT76459.1 hypothetical protein FS559_15795 [Treponema phagedenis]TYT76877.1 hypothetical protein FS559_13325 [Treponema phagedenis]TYT79834.1 hypothetical protein FS559_12530 [Treponema phagedenis]
MLDSVIFNNNYFASPLIKAAAQQALPLFISTDSVAEVQKAVKTIAEAFGDVNVFLTIIAEDNIKSHEAEKKLTLSFQKNIRLLVQKTWVEKSNEDLKEEIQYRIDDFCKVFLEDDEINYQELLPICLSILHDTVLLLFGSMIDTDMFFEYAFRIDPDFGLFWYYVEEIRKAHPLSEEKSRFGMLLAMLFLSNF